MPLCLFLENNRQFGSNPPSRDNVRIADHPPGALRVSDYYAQLCAILPSQTLFVRLSWGRSGCSPRRLIVPATQMDAEVFGVGPYMEGPNLRLAKSVDRIAAMSPQFKARVAGVLYLIVIVGGIFAEVFVRGGLRSLATPQSWSSKGLCLTCLTRLSWSSKRSPHFGRALRLFGDCRGAQSLSDPADPVLQSTDSFCLLRSR
jgi:hypothetical protein